MVEYPYPQERQPSNVTTLCGILPKSPSFHWRELCRGPLHWRRWQDQHHLRWQLGSNQCPHPTEHGWRDPRAYSHGLCPGHPLADHHEGENLWDGSFWHRPSMPPDTQRRRLKGPQKNQNHTRWLALPTSTSERRMVAPTAWRVPNYMVGRMAATASVLRVSRNWASPPLWKSVGQGPEIDRRLSR